MKICIEGPSAVGKTTLSNSLSDSFTIITEVNQLFGKRLDALPMWYYQMQFKRYELADRSINSVFDGDPFQPLWNNWSYEYPGSYFPLSKVVNIYQNAIENEKISFPDLYFILSTSSENLHFRKESDFTRGRSNFEKHLKLIKTLPQYFGFMKSILSERVFLIPNEDIEETREIVIERINQHIEKEQRDDIYLLKELEGWLSVNHPL